MSDQNRFVDMGSQEFKEFSQEMVNFIANYNENIRHRRVLPEVQPGYLANLLPIEAPQQPEHWRSIMSDIERVIMPGITHWQSPRFHAYFPAGNAYASIVADMLSGAINCIGFSWIASPACTELEIIVLNWLGKMINLPSDFLHTPGGQGGGIIQGSASESTYIALLSAKSRMIQKVKLQNPHWNEHMITSKLVVYFSTQAHSSVERAALLGHVKMRRLQPDDNFELRAETLDKFIQKDIDRGLIPFYVVAALGTTNTCSFDRLDEIGPVAKKYGLWLHVDAAYAGAAFICPEYRRFMKGIEYVDSFNFNPHKWLLVNFDCSVMWMKDSSWIVNTFNVDPIYLKHEYENKVPDFRHWQIPTGRRFRALKLWFVLRMYGVANLQAYIRQHCRLAKYFEILCKNDPRFEIIGRVYLGLVCFRLKGSNDINEALLKRINNRGNIYMVPAKIGDIFFIRMAVCSRFTNYEDIAFTWAEISSAASEEMHTE